MSNIGRETTRIITLPCDSRTSPRPKLTCTSRIVRQNVQKTPMPASGNIIKNIGHFQTPMPESGDIIKEIEGFQKIREEDKSKFVDSYMVELLSSLKILVNKIPRKLHSYKEISQSDKENIKAVGYKLYQRITSPSIQRNITLENEKQNLSSLLCSGDKEIESFEKYLTRATQKTLTDPIKTKIQQIRAFITCLASVKVDEKFMQSQKFSNLAKMKDDFVKRHNTPWFKGHFDKSVSRIRSNPDKDRHAARLIAILEQIPALNKDDHVAKLNTILEQIPAPKETAADESSEQT